ncbi:MAG: GatB/YqeY domain-containing protein [Bacteroidales bacterium]|nr:GatB/YqeY domain-containing protein [Bacteroidales bacterium]
MNLFDQISKDIMAAMKAHDQVKLEALRGAKKELLEAKTAKPQGTELEDAEAIKVLKKMVKQRKDAAQIFIDQNRQELADGELAQAGVLEAYLPAAMTAEQLEAAIKEIIAQTGATSIKEMGKVMGAANKALNGQADGKDISDCVKRLLA